MRVPAPALAILFACAATPLHAHLHWTRVNTVSPDTAALYRFDSNTVVASPAEGLPPDLGLTPTSGAALLAPATDIPDSIFGPSSLGLPSAQTLRSTDTLAAMQGDVTIECWFKWNASMSTSSLEIGLQSGAKILLARDITNPANDHFGISGTHGSFVAAPGFTNWQDVGEEEAGLNEWRHLALAIHSAGIHYDALSAHDIYSTGTVGRLYLNGHPVGSFPHSIDLSGLKVHDASRVTAIMDGGGMTIDEFTVWKRDWSENGNNTNPFADGRGASAGVKQWRMYDD